MQTVKENTQAAQELQPGIYFENSRGIYIGKHVQELALKLGWPGQQELDPDDEFYAECTEEAEDWLTENRLPIGYWLGCSEDSGDWGVWAYENEDDQIEPTHNLDTSWLNGKHTLESGAEAEINTSLRYVAIGTHYWHDTEADEAIWQIHRHWQLGTEGMTVAEAIDIWAANKLDY